MAGLVLAALTAGVLLLDLSVHGNPVPRLNTAGGATWVASTLRTGGGAALARMRQVSALSSEGSAYSTSNDVSGLSGAYSGSGSEAAESASRDGWRYRSWAADLIRHDFRHWVDTGIRQEAVEEMVTTKRYRWGSHIDAFRFQIIGGELYVDTTDIYPGSGAGQVQWFPSKNGPGNMALYGRAPLGMLALLELLHLYPGKVPDVDALLIFSDTPVVDLESNPHAAPLFCYCSNDDFAEIPFPDWAHWSGQGGWEAQRRELLAAAAAHPLAGRMPALLYRGRALETMGGDAKRAAVVACSRRLPKQHQRLVDARSVAWPSTDGAVPAASQCQWRYLIYIESYGYSASLKSRLACGAVLLQVKPVWVEWFSRGLQEGRHYLEVAAEPLQAVCPDMLATMLAVERAFGGGGRGSRKGSPGTPSEVTLQPGSGDDSTAKRVTAKALRPKPDPAAIGAAETAFVENQLRMQDVHEYMLDALGTYAALQRFTPKASAGAVRVTPEHLLHQFLYVKDREAILAAHPWLREPA